jgi:chemotaxis protein histidine kinase CheA
MEETHDPELLAEFVSESLQGLRDTEQDLLSLEGDGGSDVEVVNRIFRAVHSIKGCAGFMGLTNLVRVAHRGETLLDMLRSGKTSPTSEITDAVLAGNDALVSMLNEPDLGGSYDCEQVLDKLDRVLASLEGAEASPASEPHAAQPSADAAPQPPAAPPAPSPPIQPAPDVLAAAPDEQDAELLAEFVGEGIQGLQDVEQDLLTLEGAQEVDDDLINRVFRAVHTIKGTGSFLGLTTLVLVSHRAETLLDEVRKGTRQASPNFADAVLWAVDSLKAMLQEHDLGASYDATEVLRKLDVALGQSDAGEPSYDACAAPGSCTSCSSGRATWSWLATSCSMNTTLRDSNAFRTLSQAITGVHETVIETRMQTTGSLFERYRRVVRDLSRQAQERSRLSYRRRRSGARPDHPRKLRGSADAPGPQLHRPRFGNPGRTGCGWQESSGQRYLRSYVQSGEIILEVQDDGRGIPPSDLLSKAVSQRNHHRSSSGRDDREEKVMLIFARASRPRIRRPTFPVAASAWTSSQQHREGGRHHRGAKPAWAKARLQPPACR